MRHFIFILLASMVFGLNLNAQEVKRTEADISDYIPLLNAMGYDVYTFDISSLNDETYNIEFVVREYVNGALVEDPLASQMPRYTLRNRRMLSDFPEEYWDEILAEGPIYDRDKGILTLSEKISVGFAPASDSLRTMNMQLENIGALRRLLSLKSQTSSTGEEEYMYDYRPFKVGALQMGEFTPLVALGSYWYDEQYDLYRFCGEDELDPDLSAGMLVSSPHYYVLGITVTKK